MPLVPCSRLLARQSTDACGKNFLRCLCEGYAHAARMEIWTLLLRFLVDGTLFAHCLARQWIHVSRQLLVAFGGISGVFYVLGDSDPMVDSRPALLGFWSCVSWRSVHSRCFDRMDCPSLLHLASGHCFHQPLVSVSYLNAVWALPYEKSFWACVSHRRVGASAQALAQ